MVDDLEQWPQWIPSIKRIERVSEGPLAVGSQLCVTVKAGITVRLVMTVTELVPERCAIMCGRILGMKLTRSYILEPRDHQTLVTAGGEVSGLVAPLARRSGQALSDEILRGLKQRIER